MSDQGFYTPEVEQLAVKRHSLSFKVTIVGAATEPSVTGYCQGTPGVRLWLSSQSATAPSNANFASLISSATPTVVGIYITDTRAVRLHGVTVPVNTIRSASMTAGVITNKGATSAIAGNAGITSDGNIAFQVACTTLLASAAVLTHEFTVEVTYDVL